ncbi:MAG: helix-hairpin-helix domain-containing protein [Anaerolineae bacterium]|nr:helix-hairpin-helix domain-containing protein [Anaerolineae bacterium]
MSHTRQMMQDWWLRYRGYIFLSLAWALLSGSLMLMMRRPLGTPIELIPPPTPTATPTPSPVRVYVSGAVRSPDVYELPPMAIVRDAVRAAGGATEEADLDAINLALPVGDGMHIHVPRVGEAAHVSLMPSEGLAAAPSGSAGKLINVNTATLEELETLPGIGPAMAQRIVDGRPYEEPEDLLRVPGIGKATLAKLKPHITVH